MATERKSNAPYDPDHLNDPSQPEISEMRSPAELDQELQIDPDLAEGPASSTRMALFAIGIAIVLGVVFYGLNNSSLHQQNAATTPTPVNTQKSASTSPPAASSGATPQGNNAPGTTTGSAPANPQTPSHSSAQAGGANTNNANPGNAPANK